MNAGQATGAGVQRGRRTLSPCRTPSSERMSNVPKSAPHCCSASTTLRLKPQRGASGVPCRQEQVDGRSGGVWESMPARVLQASLRCAGAVWFGARGRWMQAVQGSAGPVWVRACQSKDDCFSGAFLLGGTLPGDVLFAQRQVLGLCTFLITHARPRRHSSDAAACRHGARGNAIQTFMNSITGFWLTSCFSRSCRSPWPAGASTRAGAARHVPRLSLRGTLLRTPQCC